MILADLILVEQDQQLTQSDLDKLERYLDALYARDNIDFEFTRHFLDRVNDIRNRKQITYNELFQMFGKAEQKFGGEIVKLGDQGQAVITDINSHINSPFVLSWNRKKQMFDLIAKTVMRKKNFKTSNQMLKV
jgi:hypothetical protein